MSLFPGVALITGSASGIGQCTAISFAREGCKKIVLADRDESGLQETKKRISDVAGEAKVEVVHTDMLDEDQVSQMVKKAVEMFGRVDYAANCAGVLSNNERSTDTATPEFDRINGINYRGAWLSSRAELKQMLTQEPLATHDGRPGSRGSIVTIASQLGLVGRARAPAYCASKAAVISMTRCDAIDYAQDGIRVNCVCPGVINTPMTAGRNAEVMAPAIAIAPMNRMGEPQEVADCVLFLSSSKASFVQGSALVVDGGYTIN